MNQITAYELNELLLNNPDNVEIVDVRSWKEFEQNKIVNSKWINTNKLLEEIEKINWNKKVIFVCRSGSRSFMITNILSSYGLNGFNLIGGIIEFVKVGGNFVV